ncbi:MAG: hypothetical protein K6T74_07330 [Geminicoccaceae bacterium]|nr:hypothetical protein [Geminicoccaceae bacterium]
MPDRKTVLVFGESQNDTAAIAELVKCLKSELHVETRRQPIILDRGAAAVKRKKMFADIAGVVRAERVRRPVHAVILHRDCDAIEPRHIEVSEGIEKEAGKALAPTPVVPATPAFELETWWFLFPDAVAAYRPGWRRLARNGQDVGKLLNAKEILRRDLRPHATSKVRDYTESDSPGIARKVRELALCGRPRARSDSFLLFAQKVCSL